MLKTRRNRSMGKIFLVSEPRHAALFTPNYLRTKIELTSLNEASLLADDVPFAHLNQARSRFQVFLDSVSNTNSPPTYLLNKAMNTGDLNKVLCQGLIRRYENAFVCSHQVLFSFEKTSRRGEMRPLFVAPWAMQIALYHRFFAGSEPHSSFCFKVLMLLGAVQYWLEFVRDVIKSLVVGFCLPILGGLRHRINPLRWQQVYGATLWFGHKSTSGSDPNRISDQLFLRDIIRIAKQDSANTLKIVMMNSSNETEKTATDGLVKSSELLKIAAPFSIGNWATLQFYNMQQCIQFIFTPKQYSTLLIESLKANYSGYFISQLNPKAGFFTNSNYLGDHTQTALKTLRIPIKFVYYSTNNACPKFGAGCLPVETLAWQYNIADCHFTWDEQSKRWLDDQQRSPISRVEAIGPIMFAATDDSTLLKETGFDLNSLPFKIGIFDVTPLSYAAAFKLGMGGGMYDIQTCKRFLSEIIRSSDIVFNREVQFIFKLKRRPLEGFHADEYLEFQHELLNSLGNRATIFEPDWNPWLALNACNAVLGIPHTSMVDAAALSGLPAAYYSPFPERVECAYKSSGTLHNQSELVAWLQKVKTAPRCHLQTTAIKSALRRLSTEF